ncbi:Venom carboxylesterase-6 [Orchesella cincta]|uniref:Venom carboxylesterase-6 n=1 Tax=Orchesella cincta TaxID=48709 RepID=A0A1D2N3S2_ORCCI|nr:Venom carboxylesterase-6 [Orchesella cincta]
MKLVWTLAILCCSAAIAEDAPKVTVSEGQIQGLTYRSRKGNKYYGFLGVPYGKAPVRFGTPQPADNWDGVKLATKFAPHCFQFCLVSQRLDGVEDCLTMNLYTPKLDGNLPVMVLLHGGGFQFGSGSLSEAKYLMDEDVVLVTIQYRLGALGFLNTEDDVVQGNMGLKDQSYAYNGSKELKKCGGDPSRVTIFGFSAGGASVHYQMLSPMSKGLFSAAISESGTALNPWAFQSKPKQLALRLAENVGCVRDTSEALVECLRSKTPAEIVTGQMKLSKFPHEFDLISMLFCPSVEKGESEPKFISDSPYNLLVDGKLASDNVPWIAGLTRDEGAFYTAGILESEKSMQKLNSDWYKMLPNILYYENSASPATQRRISKKVWEFYFGDDSKITTDKYLKLGRVLGDRFFLTGISRAIREHAKKYESPVYPYIFSHDSEDSIVRGFLHAKRSYGVAHADELKYLFNKTYGAPEYELNTDEGKFSEQLIKLLVSFARDGKPTSAWGSAKSWEPLSLSKDDETITWYEIDTDPKVTTKDPFKERTDFWESLPLKEMEKEDYPDEKDEL